MSAIQIFNVCTHGKDGGGGLSMGIPTPCVVTTHPTEPKRFATGGGDANVFIWHFSSASECGLENVAKLTYHTQPCNAVSWSSDGTRLATSGDDKMIAVWDEDQKYDAGLEQPAFGETMVFREKWIPSIKIRGPLAEVSDIEWLHDAKALVVSSLDGNIGIYSVKKMQRITSISLNTQFIQGIAVDHTLNLLAVQTTASSAKIFRIIKQKKKKHDRKYRTVPYVTLSHYPHSQSELDQQHIYNAQYKEEKKELEELQKNEAAGAVEGTADGGAGGEGTAIVAADGAVRPKPKAKPKKKRIPKCSLFKHNLITTSRKPGWSADGLLLCMVAGQSRDKSNDCIHIFHRSNLTKKVTTIVLPESSHATVARFGPLKLKVAAEGADTGSIAHRYRMPYRMLLAVICGSELFVFDTSRNEAVFYWKDLDTQNFFDMQWTADGKALVISDVEGFLTRLCIAAEDLQPSG